MGQPEVTWFDNVFHREGMSLDQIKVDTIRAWPALEDKKAAKLFLQTIQFCSPYIRPDNGLMYADIPSPLRKLTAHGKHFKWTEEYQESFNKLKELLKTNVTLSSYNPTMPTHVYVDHGPEGFGSTLTQGHRELQYRPIITTAEPSQRQRGYGKIEGESLLQHSLR